MIFRFKILYLLTIIITLLYISLICKPKCAIDLPNFNKKISCLFNNKTFQCIYLDNEYFIPLTLIKNLYEIYEKIREFNGKKYLELLHSYNYKIYNLKKYQWHGIYPSFENFNVEIRPRVKCISSDHGVPVSSQWDKNGYYYPTQIAQFGLSYFSKFQSRSNSKPFFVSKENFQDNKIYLGEIPTTYNCLNLSLENIGNVCDVQVKVLADGEKYYDLVYKVRPPALNLQKCFTFVKNRIVYTLHRDILSGGRFDLERNIYIDAVKALYTQQKNVGAKSIKLKEINFVNCESIKVRSLSFTDNLNLAYTKSSADWLLTNQDDKGGWAVSVHRNDKKRLTKGWYSAMAQGQAISLLVRYYYATRNEKYITAAVRALNVLYTKVEYGGVQTLFADRYVWLEEYPTTPSSFVLNGFMYTIVGLYDLQECLNYVSKPDPKLTSLLEESLRSLKFMLPMFDTGSRNFYDLTHITMQRSPNVARWDYHVVHLNLLRLMHYITKDDYYQRYFNLWKGYLYDQRVKHN